MASAEIAAKTVDIFKDLAISTGSLRRSIYEIVLDISKSLDISSKSRQDINELKRLVSNEIASGDPEAKKSTAWITECKLKEDKVHKLDDLIHLLATPSDSAFATVREEYFKAIIALKLCALDDDCYEQNWELLLDLLNKTLDQCNYALAYIETTRSITMSDPSKSYNSTVISLIESQMLLLKELYADAFSARQRYKTVDSKALKRLGFELVDNTVRIIKLESAMYRLVEAFKNLYQ